jgi:hypothetical protein
MVYIPYTAEQWAAIERMYRESQFPAVDSRKYLPVREVGIWWALYSGSRAVYGGI